MAYKTFSIRIEEELFDIINLIADKEERNRNQQIVFFLKKAIAEHAKDSLAGSFDDKIMDILLKFQERREGKTTESAV